MIKPHEYIGSRGTTFMKRWVLYKPGAIRRWIAAWLTKKRRFRLPSVYLHEFLRSDDDRHFHDHVGWSISIVLWGGYWEVTPHCRRPYVVAAMEPRFIPAMKHRWTWRGPGSIRFRRSTEPHFIALARIGHATRWYETEWKSLKQRPDGRRVFSLWIRGPWRRQWGFYTEQGWVDWETYVSERDQPAEQDVA